jgi:hypothetical protein
MFKEIIGTLLIITSIFDAWKYIWNAKAILRAGSSKGHSRKFILVALGNDIVKLMYGIIILDLFITISSLFALGTMSYMFYIQYLTYPYLRRGLINFKRPSIFVYFWNAIIPNKIRRRL